MIDAPLMDALPGEISTEPCTTQSVSFCNTAKQAARTTSVPAATVIELEGQVTPMGSVNDTTTAEVEVRLSVAVSVCAGPPTANSIDVGAIAIEPTNQALSADAHTHSDTDQVR